MAITVDIAHILLVVLLAYIFGMWTVIATIGRYISRPPYGPYW